MSSKFNIRSAVVRITSAIAENHEFGTGFIFHQEGSTSYIITCAHVIRDIGGDNSILVESKTAALIAYGEPDGLDLSILSVDDLRDKTKVSLSPMVADNQMVSVIGFSKEGQYRVLKMITGILGESFDIEILNQAARTNAWYFSVDDNSNPLIPGYSGSPVFDKMNNLVIGVVVANKGERQGIIISLSDLPNLKRYSSLDFNFLLKDQDFTFFPPKRKLPTQEVVDNSSINTFSTQTSADPLSTQSLDEETVSDSQTLLINEISNFLTVEVYPTINQSTPKLIESLTTIFVDGLVERVMRPSLKSWRQGQIKNLNDLDNHIKSEAASWLQSDETKINLETNIINWLKPIWVQTTPYLRQISKEYDVPESAINTIFGQSVPVSLSMNNPLDFVSPVAGLFALVSFIGVFNLPLIAMAVSAAFVSSASVIPLIVVIVSTIVTVWKFGSILDATQAAGEKIEESMRSANLPGWLRRFSLSDKKIEEICATQKRDAPISLNKTLTQEFERIDFPSKVIQALKYAIEVQIRDHPLG